MWEKLYEKHYKELVRYCYGIYQDVELAQDMAQETFLKALQNCHILEDLGPQQRRAWLFKAARNLLYDKLRRATLESRTLPALEAQEEQEEGGVPGFGGRCSDQKRFGGRCRRHWGNAQGRADRSR